MNNVARPAAVVQPVEGAYVYYDPATSYSGSGTVLTDLSGNNRNGLLVNSPTWTSGTGGYFTLNGTNQYLSTPNLYNSGLEPHTVEVWVRPTASNVNLWSDSSTQDATAYHASGSQLATVGPFQQYWTGLWANGGVGTQRVVAGAGTFTNTWSQVVRVYNGTTCTPYLNGVAGSGATMNWTTPSENGNGNVWYLNFGISETTTYLGQTATWFSGRFGIIRVYYSALTAAQILQNYNADKSKYGL